MDRRVVVVLVGVICLACAVSAVRTDSEEEALEVQQAPSQSFSPDEVAALTRLKRSCNRAKKRLRQCGDVTPRARARKCSVRRQAIADSRCARLQRYANVLWKQYRSCFRARRRHFRMWGNRATQAKLADCDKNTNQILRVKCKRRMLKHRAKSVVATFKKCRDVSLNGYRKKLTKKLTKECKNERTAYETVFGGDYTATKTQECRTTYGADAKYAALVQDCISKANAGKAFTYNKVVQCESRLKDLQLAFDAYSKASQPPEFLSKWRTEDRLKAAQCRHLKFRVRRLKRRARKALKGACGNYTTVPAIEACMKPFISGRDAGRLAAVQCDEEREHARTQTVNKVKQWRVGKATAYEALKPFIKQFASDQPAAVNAFLDREKAARAARIQAARVAQEQSQAHAQIVTLKAQLQEAINNANDNLKKSMEYRDQVIAAQNEARMAVLVSTRLRRKLKKCRGARADALAAKAPVATAAATTTTPQQIAAPVLAQPSTKERRVCKLVKQCKSLQELRGACEKVMQSPETQDRCKHVYGTDKAAVEQCKGRAYSRCVMNGDCTYNRQCSVVNQWSWRAVMSCSRKRVCKKPRPHQPCQNYSNGPYATARCQKECANTTGTDLVTCTSTCKTRIYNECTAERCSIRAECPDKTCTCTRRTKATCESPQQVERRNSLCSKVKDVSAAECQAKLSKVCRARWCTCAQK